jgi:hypothetical protein
MKGVKRQLRHRMREILSYLKMLQFIERAGGPVSLHGRHNAPMSLSQNTVHVMKAGVFLHLYNLIESTVTNGLKYIAEEIKATKTVFLDLNSSWRKAWATSVMKLDDEELTHDSRLAGALRLCEAVAEGKGIEIQTRFKVGGLDDKTIEGLVDRYGISLSVRPKIRTGIKHQVHDKLGFLELVRKRRNELAHGHGSFADIGKDYTTTELVKWSWLTYQYLKEVLASFEVHVVAQLFRGPPRAPAGAS